MSINRGWDPHRGELTLIPGEGVCRRCENVELSLSGPTIQGILKGSHKGMAFLTTQRFVFSTRVIGGLQSLSMPFYCLKGIEVKQPLFGANHIQGNVSAEENGGWTGTAVFKLYFNGGGAIDFAMEFLHLLRTAPPMPPAYNQFQQGPPANSAVCAPYPTGQPGVMPTAPAYPDKATEAGQAAYYQPSNPHAVYMPAMPSAPPADDGLPPSYDAVATKKNI